MNFPGLFCIHLLFQNILQQWIPWLPCVENYFFYLWFDKMLSLDLRTVQHNFWLDYLCIYLQNASPQRILVTFDNIHLLPFPLIFFPRSVVMEILGQNWFCSRIGILSHKSYLQDEMLFFLCFHKRVFEFLSLSLKKKTQTKKLTKQKFHINWKSS